MFVGVHTWWPSSVDVTVATVITTWLQYNNTIIPSNSTVKQASRSATACYGTWAAQPDEAIHVNGGGPECEYNPFTEQGLPTDLLGGAGTFYGASWISPETAYTVTTQGLTILSPTPFYLFGGVDSTLR